MTEPSRFSFFNAPTTLLPVVEIPPATPFSARTDFYNALDPETQTHLSDREVRNRISTLDPEFDMLIKQRTTRPDGGVYSWSEIYADYNSRHSDGEQLSQLQLADWTMSRIMAGISNSVTRNHCDPDAGPVHEEKADLQVSIYGIRDYIGPTIENTLYTIADEFVK